MIYFTANFGQMLLDTMQPWKKIACLLLCLPMIISAQSWRESYQTSIRMYEANAFDSMLFYTVEALKSHPSQPALLYNKAVAESLLKKYEDAAKSIEYLLSWNTQIHPEKDEDFKSLFTTEYAQHFEKLRQNFDQRKETGTVFRSLGKVHAEDLAIAERGTAVTDVHEGFLLYYTENQLTKTPLGGAGMAVCHFKDDLFFVTSAQIPEYAGFQAGKPKHNQLLLVDAAKGNILDSINLNAAIIGDMCLSKTSILYLSNSAQNEILVYGTNLKSMSEAVHVRGAFSLQGIDLDPTNQFLYIADYIRGICRIDLKSGNQDWLTSDAYLLKGIDGLICLSEKELLIIQNNSMPKRLASISLENGNISQVHILENALDYAGEPTNAFLFKGDIYYIANSPWPHYKDGKALSEMWENLDIRKLER